MVTVSLLGSGVAAVLADLEEVATWPYVPVGIILGKSSDFADERPVRLSLVISGIRLRGSGPSMASMKLNVVAVVLHWWIGCGTG